MKRDRPKAIGWKEMRKEEEVEEADCQGVCETKRIYIRYVGRVINGGSC